jgi:hypothetical protein
MKSFCQILPTITNIIHLDKEILKYIDPRDKIVSSVFSICKQNPKPCEDTYLTFSPYYYLCNGPEFFEYSFDMYTFGHLKRRFYIIKLITSSFLSFIFNSIL